MGSLWSVRFYVIVLLLVLGLGRAALAQEVLGKWLTESGNAQVEIKVCGDKLCGEIVWLREPLNEQAQPKKDFRNENPSLRERPILGMQILEGFLKSGSNGKWENGTIYNAEDGKIYRANMSLENSNTLRVRGYVGLPLFGKSQTWTRIQ